MTTVDTNLENRKRIIDGLKGIEAKTIKVGRGSAYNISYENEFAKSRFTRATTVLGVINKEQLNGWRVKKAVENFREALAGYVGETISVNEEWLDKVTQEAKDHPGKVAGEADDIGTAVHALIEAELKGLPAPQDIPSEAIQPFERWLEWREKCGLDLALPEVTVFHRELGVAGTFDCLAFDENGWPVLLDWKTSKGIYSSFAYQMSFYGRCVENLTGVSVVEARAVHITAEGVTEYTVKDLDEAYEVFEAAVKIRKAEKEDWFVR